VKRPVECLCFLYSIGVPVIKDADHSGRFLRHRSAVMQCSPVTYSRIRVALQFSPQPDIGLAMQQCAPHLGWEE